MAEGMGFTPSGHKLLILILFQEYNGGRDGIRTHGTGKRYTRFPSVLIRPLWHPSKKIKKAHKKVFCVLAVISKTNEGTTSSSRTNIFVPYAILFW